MVYFPWNGSRPSCICVSRTDEVRVLICGNLCNLWPKNSCSSPKAKCSTFTKMHVNLRSKSKSNNYMVFTKYATYIICVVPTALRLNTWPFRRIEIRRYKIKSSRWLSPKSLRLVMEPINIMSTLEKKRLVYPFI